MSVAFAPRADGIENRLRLISRGRPDLCWVRSVVSALPRISGRIGHRRELGPGDP